MAPSAIRYQANTRKVCFSTNRTSALTTNNAEMKAATNPSPILSILSDVKILALRMRS